MRIFIALLMITVSGSQAFAQCNEGLAPYVEQDQPGFTLDCAFVLYPDGVRRPRCTTPRLRNVERLSPVEVRRTCNELVIAAYASSTAMTREPIEVLTPNQRLGLGEICDELIRVAGQNAAGPGQGNGRR